MKKILQYISVFFAMILMSFALSGCQAEDVMTDEAPTDGPQMTNSANSEYYYWYKGEKIYLTLNTEYVNVIADDSFLKYSSTSSQPQKYSIAQDYSSTTGNLVKLRMSSKLVESEYSTTINTLKQDQQVKYVLPFFERTDAEPIGTSDVFYLKLKSESDLSKLTEVAGEHNVQIIKEVPHMPLWYILSIQNSSFSHSVDASNYFYETGYFADIDPAFMFNFKSNSTTGIDPMFGQLWGLKNTSYPGIDINAVNAWSITRGEGATVAVVDQGIDPNHNDLKANFHPLNFDAQSGTSPSVYNPSNSHGTHVAGTVAAVGYNNLQVIGVAYESKIMRVSHMLFASNTASAELASGINWAWQNGADVITNSWGDQGGAYYNYLYSTILEEAIEDAITQGRDGLGSVVVFAAGNYPTTMDYPATCNDGILTVGAITSTGVKASFSGSGAKLDVVAPGENILSTTPNNNTSYKSGTSMAAPHVAGVAALLLSENPRLTQKAVTHII